MTVKQVGSKAIDLTKNILLELKQVTSDDMSPVSLKCTNTSLSP